MKELHLNYMKNLIFMYIDNEVTKVDFIESMLEHINQLQILIEEENK